MCQQSTATHVQLHISFESFKALLVSRRETITHQISTNSDFDKFSMISIFVHEYYRCKCIIINFNIDFLDTFLYSLSKLLLNGKENKLHVPRREKMPRQTATESKLTSPFLMEDLLY